MRLLFILFSFTLTFGLISCGESDTTDSTSLSDEELHQKADELAHKFIITDGHVDLPFRLQNKFEDISKRTEGGDFDYDRAKEGGLDAPFMSIYTPSGLQGTPGANKKLADSLIDMVVKLTVDFPDKFALAHSPEEVQQNFEKGVISLPMGMENGAPIEDQLANIAYFHKRGIRYITLTHATDNLICDSSYDTTHTHNGLSDFGIEVVKEMNRVGIMIDVSHISDSTFYQVMKTSEAPVIASHSSCRHFTPGWERNMSDEMIKLLAKNDGIIQINFGSTFISQESLKQYETNKAHIEEWQSENGYTDGDSVVKAYTKSYYAEHPVFSTVEAAADHIDHVVKLVGIDHVGFGSDFDGLGDSLPEGLKDVSDFPDLIFNLLKRGYSDEDIEKICYKNVFRVWQKTEEVARKMKGALN